MMERLRRSWFLKGTTGISLDLKRMKSRCLGGALRKLGSSKLADAKTFKASQYEHEKLVAHQLVKQLLVAGDEDNPEDLKH